MKKLKLIPIIIIFFICNFSILGQNSSEINLSSEQEFSSAQSNSDQNEIIKSSILLSNDFLWSFSVSYERIIPLKNNWNVSLRGGPAYSGESGDDLALIGQVSMLSGKSKHFFETGIAYYQNVTFPDAFIIPLAGYRFMGKKGLSFKIYGDLLMDVIDNSEFGFLNPGLHLSVGYRFNL